MIPQFYWTHLQQYLTRAQELILGLLLNLLQSEWEVKRETLARVPLYPIRVKIPRRKLQTFWHLPQLISS
jgi:hypothetical protein